MSYFQTLIIVFATIALFLYGLKSFSEEVKKLSTEKLQSLISKVTRYSISGFILGAVLTSIIQSSSAVSSITVALVDSGVISFVNSLSVLLGANVGSTSTAWLVTFNVGAIAPYFIILGMIISLIPSKIQLAGKSVFYFGFILFSLELISQSIEPFKTDPFIVTVLKMTDNHIIGILSGIVVTALVQSSSVTTGLAILLTQQGILNSEGAISIILGSNIGTSSTALIASLQLNKWAKLSATSNFIFNCLGVLICFPFINLLNRLTMYLSDDITYQVAYAHLLFNIFLSLLILPFIKKIAFWLESKFFTSME
ncbi:Na/Pi symporter [Chryseobacterium sp. RG1]|uniref:Na/Pi symporter n=1 Tax=Chryseobacterium tagetis TaxID=2801334 RepID=A0ABS8A0G5_9FLAO|nr:Na/Pi symporter [Chryseobacterium tagetis]MCA6066196.1 Na/Pi symporter [Chryseobacterium tagetis]